MFKATMIACGLLALASPAYALHAEPTEILMAKVKTSYPVGYKGQIVAQLADDNSGIARFKFTDSRGTAVTFTVEDLRKGVVLVHQIGKDILKIKAPDFSAQDGGQLNLTVLTNFFGSDRRVVRFDYLRKGAMTDWYLQTDDADGHDVFDTIFVGIYKKVGIPSGISRIVLSAGESQIREYLPSKLPQSLRRYDYQY